MAQFDHVSYEQRHDEFGPSTNTIQQFHEIMIYSNSL